MRKVFISLLFCTSLYHAQDQFESIEQFETSSDTIKKLQEVTVRANGFVGSKFRAKNLASTTHFISNEELGVFNYGDINRILRQTPGIYVVEEEGFGLRPSIGLRGTSPSRSSKITLMEDGVLIAPAPYTAPAAYYFPTVNRIQAFEILKGGTQVQYGPFTTGGAINMISTAIPKTFQAKIIHQMGSFGTNNTYFHFGDSYEQFGYLVEYNNRNSNGFKTIDFSDRHTGFDGNDYLAKLKWQTKTTAKVFQSLQIKAQYSEDVSNETYLGLTEEHFWQNPYRRYLASEQDQINTKHKQLAATHVIIPTNNLSFTTTAYRNEFDRNWYKLHDVRHDNVTVSMANILNNPAQNDIYMRYLTGETNTQNGALRYRNNNRGYVANGVQSLMNYKFNGGELKHDLEIGARFHEDFEDRFQWDDRYTITNQKLLKTSAGTPGTQDNRVGYTKAWAFHALYNLTYKNFLFTPGVRHETITRINKVYTNDLERTGNGLNRTEISPKNVWIPGFSALYKWKDHSKIFASVHKGFSPAGAIEEQNPEISWNKELGYRFENKRFETEIVIYRNDFSQLLGADTNAAGGTGEGDLFNAGQAVVQGLELSATIQVLDTEKSKMKWPFSLSYTLTDTELKSNFNSGVEAWGSIKTGDEIPYVAKHQFGFISQWLYEKFSFSLSGKYNGKFRTRAGQGEIPSNELIKSNFILDAALSYGMSKNVVIYSTANNLFDAKYAVARVPAGMRPGMPFAVNVGVKLVL